MSDVVIASIIFFGHLIGLLFFLFKKTSFVYPSLISSLFLKILYSNSMEYDGSFNNDVSNINSSSKKAGFLKSIWQDLTTKYNAVVLVKSASEVLGGKGGGGRKDFAQAGGSNKDSIEKAFKVLNEKIN